MLFALGACASSGSEYPSLSIRDAERTEGTFESPEPKRLDVPPVEVDLTGGLDARLDSLVGAAREAHAEFNRIEPGARQLVAAASGSDIASDRWAAAQVALAELDSARSRAAVPLADLDALYTASRVAADDITKIDDARSTVIAMVSEEDAVLANLRGSIR
ncbi:hypothetical protein K3165_04280 [Qipengyuania sp. 1XM1-15A]|uniref:hypothetical protein n=1 Tax=Qipengyuania xiamenensis TaxID=2867237 RepID=UPI001C886955|nr:hypothetical protein [Qipengyuania xiamenensis]MBX7532137.1 hypothetical protein [Qipengyuania xiamenensis]